jgi:hypothetical protein
LKKGTTVQGENLMSKKMMLIIMLAASIVLAFPIRAAMATNKGTIPSISVVSVVPGTVVTIETRNFPADLDFEVTIGPYGSYGIDGTLVGSTNSGKGGVFTATYNIPVELKDSARLAIRLRNPSKGYYAYNWFENIIPTPAPTKNTDTKTTLPGYVGFPEFTVTEVKADKSVSVDAKNFPVKANVDVTMNVIGTFGSGGYLAKSQFTGEKGEFTATYDIPKELVGIYMISIRIQDPVSGYYGINWFFNLDYPVKAEIVSTPAAAPNPGPTPTPGTSGSESKPTTPAYSGYPRVEITAVEKDVKVTIQAMNLPLNEKFDVYLGNLGSMAVGGTKVATLESGTTGTATATYVIPTDLVGLGQISVRLASTTSDYYGYNWFYNQTYP